MLDVRISMTPKAYAIVGWLSGAVFWITYIVMAEARADYFHRTKAVSELGSVDATNAVYWNAIGFVAVGLLISTFAIGLKQSVSTTGKGRIAFFLLFFCGLFWALAGIFPGDFEDRDSLTMIVHAVGALGSGLCFVLSVLFYVPAMRSTRHWRNLAPISLALAIAFFLSGFLRTGSAPALGQKIGFLIFFLWIAVMAWRLFQPDDTPTTEQVVEHEPL